MRSDLQRVREYELMAIFAPDVPEEEMPGAIERVSAIIAEAGGTVTSVNRDSPWGRRRLAYPIRHNSRDVRDGIYALYYFQLDTTRVIEVERDLKLTDNIIRHMVTHQIAIPVAPVVEGAEGEAATVPVEAEATAEVDDAVNVPTSDDPTSTPADTVPAETGESTETGEPVESGEPTEPVAADVELETEG